jgi:lysozyme
MRRAIAVALVATCATLSLAHEKEYHHHHHHDEVHNYGDYYEHDSDVHVKTGTWNVAGTKSLIKEFEGLRLTAYQDIVGVWTIGYGHTGSDVYPGLKITEAQADSLLEKDLGRFVSCVTSYVKVPLNPNQNGALVSFSFNLGCGSLQSSTLLRRLNAGENPNTVAREEMPKWNKAGGKVVEGLVRRRAAEVKFFTS